MKKMAVWSIVALMLALTACGSNNSNSDASSGNPDSGTSSDSSSKAPEKSKDPVTVRITLSKNEVNQDLLAEFETEHPGIKIAFEELDNTKLAAQLATNSAPDIIATNGVFGLPSYVTRGIALDLTDRIKNSTAIDMNDLMPVVDVYRFDGVKTGSGPYYGLPKDWSNDYALFYNKKAFEAAGVEVPDATKPLTWPEVMDLAKRLTIKKDGKIVQYGLSATEWGKTEPNFNQMMQYLASAGAQISNADNTKVDFNVQAVKDYLAMWIDATKENIGPNSVNGDQTSGGDLFLQNKSALLIDGFWYGGAIRGNADAAAHIDDFGMLPTPLAPGGERVAATGSATGAIINKNSQHIDEAWTFFEWFFSGKSADDRAKSGWGLPIYKSKMALLPQNTEFDKRLYAVLMDELNYAGKFLPINPYLSGGGWDIFDKYAQPLYFGKSSIDEAVAGMTKDANIAIEEAVNSMKK